MHSETRPEYDTMAVRYLQQTLVALCVVLVLPPAIIHPRLPSHPASPSSGLLPLVSSQVGQQKIFRGSPPQARYWGGKLGIVFTACSADPFRELRSDNTVLDFRCFPSLCSLSPAFQRNSWMLNFQSARL